MIHLNTQAPILFIDGSYFVFYRFYAVYSWWSRLEENKEKSSATAMSDPVFREKYSKMFKSVLNNLKKVYQVPDGNMVFAKDCPREQIWRHAVIDSYKGTRDSQNLDKTVFTETFNTIIPSIECPVLYADHLEADDVIAIAVNHVLRHNPCADITIVTNDNDYVQLCDKAHIVNLQGKLLSSRVPDPKSYLLYKTIIGDKSDNIPSIKKLIGQKTAEKLTKNPNDLQTLFEKHPEAKLQFDKNDLLINFDRIPEQYADVVKQNITLL